MGYADLKTRRPSSPWLIHGLEPTAYTFAAAPLAMPVKSKRAVMKECEAGLITAEEIIEAVIADWPTMSQEKRLFLEPQLDRISRLIQRYTCLQMHLPPVKTPTNSPDKQPCMAEVMPRGQSPPADWVTL